MRRRLLQSGVSPQLEQKAIQLANNKTNAMQISSSTQTFRAFHLLLLDSEKTLDWMVSELGLNGLRITHSLQAISWIILQFLSLKRPCVHTRTHAQTNARRRTHTHACTHTRTHERTHTHLVFHPRKCHQQEVCHKLAHEENGIVDVCRHDVRVCLLQQLHLLRGHLSLKHSYMSL